MIWLMRMKRWAQNPPSKRRVQLVFGVVALCVAIVLVEYFYGWPDALSLENKPQRLPTLR